MAEENPTKTNLVKVNDVDLYSEMRGTGPAVLFIPGIGGDASLFSPITARLCDAHTIISYDHRGQSRSFRKSDWIHTSITEMADDAAGILKGSSVKSAVVFGTDIGGLIALELMLHYPQLVKKAIIHDPIIYAAISDGPYSNVLNETGMVLREKFVTIGGPAGLANLLSQQYGTKAFNSIENLPMMRMLSNGEVFITKEFPAYAYYKPDVARLSTIKTPIKILSSTGSPAWQRDMCNWLGKVLKTDPIPFLNSHAPYLENPVETAEALKVYL